MKLLSGYYSPTMRLGSTLFCIFCLVSSLADAKSGPPSPACWLAMVGAALLSAVLELLRARRDRLGDVDYLRRQVAGHRSIWSGTTAWEKGLLLTLITLCVVAVATDLLSGTDWTIWLALGVFSGQLVGYSHWRAHWQRLQGVTAGDEQSHEPIPG